MRSVFVSPRDGWLLALLLVISGSAIFPQPTDGQTSASVKIGRHFPGNPDFEFDSDAAVSTRQFVELSNRSFRVYNKYTGTLVYEDLAFFPNKLGLVYVFDQRLRFDHATQRWIV